MNDTIYEAVAVEVTPEELQEVLAKREAKVRAVKRAELRETIRVLLKEYEKLGGRMYMKIPCSKGRRNAYITTCYLTGTTDDDELNFYSYN